MNLTKLHPRPFTCAFVIIGRNVAHMVWIIWPCACQKGLTWGWPERRILLPYVSWCLSQLASAHWVYFVLLCVFQTPWPFGEIIEDSDLFLRVTFFVFSMSPTVLEVPKLSLYNAFQRRLRSCRKIFFNHTRSIWIFRPVQYSWGHSLLSPGFWLFEWSSGGTSFGILIIPNFPIFGVLPRSSWKDCSATASNVSRTLLTSFCFTRLITEMVLEGRLPSLWRYFKCIRLSSCLVRRRE